MAVRIASEGVDMPTSEIIARNTLWWSNEVDRLEAQVASLRNDIVTYNQVLAGLKDGELTWDSVQVLESGQLRVMPPPPKPDPAPPEPDKCVEEVSKEFGTRNGKRPETALERQESPSLNETAVVELAEAGNGT